MVLKARRVIDSNDLRTFYEDYGAKKEVLDEHLIVGKWKAENLNNAISKNKTFKRILEVGSGTGVVLSNLSITSPLKIGVDISASLTKEALKHYPSNRYIISDVKFLPFKNNSIDLIILSDIVEHVDDISIFFYEIKRVGNNFIMNIPLEDSLHTRILHLFKKKNPVGKTHISGHLYEFNYGSALKLLRENNFKITYSKIAIHPYVETLDKKIKLSDKILMRFNKFIRDYALSQYHHFFDSSLIVSCTVEGGIA